ncbi:MAG TPA: type II secretion system protein GspJ [Verrucomicrobiae bacterium]|jgi:general secretion pathway protein J|nr:type II secretion system protein GspJ [Verrucomicrobiae bacterium]
MNLMFLNRSSRRKEALIVFKKNPEPPNVGCYKIHLKARGFTIIEILTAMAIFGMVVAAIFASWQAIIRGSVSGNRAAATAQRSRVALRTIEEALGSTRSFVADVQYYTFETDSGSEPSLSFVARLSPEFPRSGRFGQFNVRRVTFSVEQGPDRGKRLVLRQAPVLMDMDEDEQNYPVVLANDVRKFEMEFWDKQKGDWLDEWTQTNQLPQMVKFTMQLGGDQDEITRIVALASVAVQAGWQVPGSTAGGPGFQFHGPGGTTGGGSGFQGGGAQGGGFQGGGFQGGAPPFNTPK